MRTHAPPSAAQGSAGRGGGGATTPAVAEPQGQRSGRAARVCGCSAAPNAAGPPAAGLPRSPGAPWQLLAGAASRSSFLPRSAGAPARAARRGRSTVTAAGPGCAPTTAP